MPQIETAEDAVPVRAVALRAPQGIARVVVVDAFELAVDAEPALVHVVGFRVLREEAAPEAATHVLQYVAASFSVQRLGQLVQLARGVRRHRPLHHLRV